MLEDFPVELAHEVVHYMLQLVRLSKKQEKLVELRAQSTVIQTASEMAVAACSSTSCELGFSLCVPD